MLVSYFLFYEEETIDYVSVESFGASGNDSMDDAEAIQAAIDYSYENKAGKVLLKSRHEYVLKSGLVLKEGVQLEFGHHASLLVNGDFRVMEIEKGASVMYGQIKVVSADFDSDVIYLDGNQQFWSWDQTKIVGLTLINTTETHKGTGLLLQADSGGEFISFALFENVTVAGFHTGVKLEAGLPDEDEVTFINGNRFLHLTVDDSVHAIEFDSSRTVPNEVSGNQFSNLQIQLSAISDKAMIVTGSDNRVDGVVWDVEKFAADKQVLEFTDQSLRNVIDMNVSDRFISDNGELNEYRTVFDGES
ncbi:hypothetical protein EQV77_09740 [Halobacillus fulvus]|nr:hypothetical protein EQV77_09740 [Halobacillus fulvus]